MYMQQSPKNHERVAIDSSTNTRCNGQKLLETVAAAVAGKATNGGLLRNVRGAKMSKRRSDRVGRRKVSRGVPREASGVL